MKIESGYSLLLGYLFKLVTFSKMAGAEGLIRKPFWGFLTFAFQAKGFTLFVLSCCTTYRTFYRFSSFRRSTNIQLSSRLQPIKALFHSKMAGAEGFEPSNAEIKTPCLAAWRRPNKKIYKLREV